MNPQENAREQTARRVEEAITILKEVVAHDGPGGFAGRLPDGAGATIWKSQGHWVGVQARLCFLTFSLR